MRYRSREHGHEVTAVQWFPGVAHPCITERTPTDDDPEIAFHRNHPDGVKTPVRPGDWIVGEVEHCYMRSASRFERHFEAL